MEQKTANNIRKQLQRLLSYMKTRCYNKNHMEYSNYGGKGITICDKWLGKNGFNNFYNWAIESGFTGEKNSKNYNIQTIDRIDNTKGYSPDNCKWSNRFEQANNKTTSIFVEYNGKKDTLSNLCRELNLDYHAVFLRIYRRHWSIEKALSTPIIKDYELEYNGKIYNLTDLAALLGIKKDTLKYQYVTKKKSIEEAIHHCLYEKGVRDAKNI